MTEITLKFFCERNMDRFDPIYPDAPNKSMFFIVSKLICRRKYNQKINIM